MQLHDKLRALRLSRYYTQQDIAEMLGVTRSTISNFEIGRRKPEIDVLEKLAEIYGVDLNYFATNSMQSSDLMLLVKKAESIFNDPAITEATKDRVYQSLMKVYLTMKEGSHHDKHTL